MISKVNTVLHFALVFLLSYASCVSIYVSFIKRKDFDLLTVFYVVTLFAFSILSIYKLTSLIKRSLSDNLSSRQIQSKQLYNKKALLLIFLCFFSFITGFFNIQTQYDRGLFFDEANQFSRAFYQGPDKSYKDQQPPLDYYFSAFSAYIFGFNKSAVRSHAIFFYLFLACIISLIFYSLSSSFWISFGVSEKSGLKLRGKLR